MVPTYGKFFEHFLFLAGPEGLDKKHSKFGLDTITRRTQGAARLAMHP
jgi:hypothetical protein